MGSSVATDDMTLYNTKVHLISYHKNGWEHMKRTTPLEHVETSTPFDNYLLCALGVDKPNVDRTRYTSAGSLNLSFHSFIGMRFSRNPRCIDWNALSSTWHLLLHLGRALLHCPLAWQVDFTAPWRTYPVLQAKRTLSFKLNWVPWVIPMIGLPGWPHVMAGKVKEERNSVF